MKMKKGHRILLAATVGVILLILSDALMAGKTGLVPVGAWGVLVGFIGLLVISYAAYQTHEALLALFWGALALIFGYFGVVVSEGILMAYLSILLLVIPGIGLTIYGVNLFLKSRRGPRET